MEKLEGDQLADLTRQRSDFVVDDLAKRSTFGEAQIVAHVEVRYRSQATDLSWNRGQAVAGQL